VKESAGAVPVAGAVVRGEGDRHDWADSEHAANGPRPVYDSADTQHRHLWRIDHRQNGVDPQLAEIGDSDRRVAHFLSGQPSGPGSTDKVAQGSHQLVEVVVLRITDRGRDETAVPKGYGHAEMHLLARPKPALHPMPVQVADLDGGQRDSPQEQGGGQYSARRWPVSVAVT
jgi:hypothetical protein